MIIFKKEKASLTPSFVIIVMAMMIIGSYFFCMMKIYANRTVVRDAADAALVSALAGAVSVGQHNTNYYESLECAGRDSEGNCTSYVWVPHEGGPRNYLKIDRGEAEKIAKEYFEKNLKNNLQSSEFKVKKFTLYYSFDKEREITVRSNRENTSPPSPWWHSEFGVSQPPAHTGVSSREVIFPRWGKIRIEATVELDIPLTRLFGVNGKTDFNWSADAVKELKELEEEDEDENG